MRYEDHVQKTKELREKLDRLRGKPSQDAVIDYLIESAEAFLRAAEVLVEIEGEKKEKAP